VEAARVVRRGASSTVAVTWNASLPKRCHSIIRFKLNSVRARVVEADLLAGACRGLHDGHILRRCSIHLRIVKYSESTTPRRAILAQPLVSDSCNLCVAPPPAMGPFPRCA
jgi:hypothetical protein